MTEFGEQIPNSKYYRAYCFRCGEPMRVTETRLEDIKTAIAFKELKDAPCAIYCEECSPHSGGGGHAFVTSTPDNDYDAWAPSWKAGN